MYINIFMCTYDERDSYNTICSRNVWRLGAGMHNLGQDSNTKQALEIRLQGTSDVFWWEKATQIRCLLTILHASCVDCFCSFKASIWGPKLTHAYRHAWWMPCLTSNSGDGCHFLPHHRIKISGMRAAIGPNVIRISGTTLLKIHPGTGSSPPSERFGCIFWPRGRYPSRRRTMT